MSAAQRLRVMVVDDHTLFRRGLIALLDADGRFEVVGEAGDAADALRVAATCSPQVILLDNHLPGASGVASLPALIEASGGAQVLMLTMSEDERDLAAAMRGGAAGYLLKTADGDDLAQAILRAVQGQTSISPAMAARLGQAFRSGDAETAAPDALAELSPREREILEQIARGASNKEIARALSIAETTVKVHVQHILRKLNLSSRVQAAVVMASKRA
jgi:two-component system, NarL family, nitrate/nitrite response regulator NarL